MYWMKITYTNKYIARSTVFTNYYSCFVLYKIIIIVNSLLLLTFKTRLYIMFYYHKSLLGPTVIFSNESFTQVVLEIIKNKSYLKKEDKELIVC